MKALLPVLILIALATQEVRGGCGLPLLTGRSGDRLHGHVLQTEERRQFSIDLTASTLWIGTIDRGAISGSGDPAAKMWFANRVEAEPRKVFVFSEPSGDAERPEFLIDLPFEPWGYSWTEDSQGDSWLFFRGSLEGTLSVAAYRLTPRGWKWYARVREDISGRPRADPTSRSIVMGTVIFSAGAQPRRVDPLPPTDERHPSVVDVFPLESGEMLAITGLQADAWLSSPQGWTSRPGPWKGVPKASASTVPSDGPAPVIAWDDGDFKRFHRWDGKEWSEIASIDKTAWLGGGPMMVLGDTVIVIGSCYRFATHESITVTTAKGDEMSTRTLKPTGGTSAPRPRKPLAERNTCSKGPLG